jgi:outer membrane protein OmpA-like peptidoglycan-associated protein
MKLFIRTLLVPSVLLLLASGAHAADPELDVTDYGDSIPSTDELINALDPEMGVRTRSLGEPPKQRSVSLGIEFQRNSYELTESAENVLNRLGGAMASPQLSKHEFMVEGHTDATGSREYNQELSEKRAMTVKNYLVNVFGIESSRLKEVGRGQSALLDGANPESGVNRRVQIINLAQ